MKTHNHKIHLLFLCFAVISLCFITCDVNDPRDDFKIIFNLEKIETVISGIIVNAATGEPVNSTQVHLSIEGEDKNNIVDLTAQSKTEFSTSEGFISFALTQSAIPSESNPISIVIRAKADGYITNFLTLDILEKGSTSFILSMVAENDLPAGVCTEGIIIQTDNNGVTTSITTLSVTEPETDIEASITIPLGVKLLDKNNTPLSGALSGTITYYSPVVEEALKVFPGGFNVNTSTNGQQEKTTFVTAGVTEITIEDAAGNQVNKFEVTQTGKISIQDESKPAVLIEIPPETFNPETNSPIKEGDEVDLWSLESEAIEWNWENEPAIQYNNETGKYFIEFFPEHLTKWNFDWKSTQCWKAGTLIFTGIEFPYPLRIKLIGNNGQFFWTKRFFDGKITFYRPPNFPLDISIYDGSNNELLDQRRIEDLCAVGTIYWQLNFTAPLNTTEVVIKTDGWCKCDTNIILRPAGNPIWYQDRSSTAPEWVYAGTTEEGQITINGIYLDRLYSFATWYEGRWYEIGAVIYENYAQVNAPLTSSNIIKAYAIDKNTIYFKGELSEQICNDLCSQEN